MEATQVPLRRQVDKENCGPYTQWNVTRHLDEILPSVTAWRDPEGERTWKST